MSDNINKKKRGNIFIDFLSKIENFNFSDFKQEKEEKKKQKEQEKKEQEEDKALEKDSTITYDDVDKHHASKKNKIITKAVMWIFIFMFVYAAIIVSLQDNEKKSRKQLNIQKDVIERTSFGSIGEKDYYMEQNALERKITIIQEENKRKNEEFVKSVKSQTKLLKDYISFSAQEQEKKNITRTKKLEEKITKKLNEVIDKKLTDVKSEIEKVKQDIKKVKESKISGKVIFPSNFARTDSGKDSIENKNEGLVLKNGKVYFQTKDDNTNHVKHYKINAIEKQSDKNDAYNQENNNSDTEDEYQIDYFDVDTFETLNVATLQYTKTTKSKKLKSFESDILVGLTKVTLINGFKAPTMDIGVANPVPVLMTIESDLYLANDFHTNLKGCFITGTAFGNINTSRAEVFGTHISCVVVAKNGVKYKVDQAIPSNMIWIQGEDGANGISGHIVDSSGKIISRSVAMGFLEGMSKYFASQASGGTTTLTSSAATVQTAKATMQSGLSSGMSKSFDIVIKQYEKLLNGYFPFIDVKGGRKNLTALFGGKIRLKFEPFQDPNLDIHRNNNFAAAYEQNSEKEQ